MNLESQKLIVQVKRKAQREQLSSTEGIQKAQLSQRLVTIQTDVNLPPVRQAFKMFLITCLHMLDGM